MLTPENKYSMHNQTIDYKSVFDIAILFIEATMNKLVGGFHEVW